MNYKLDLHTHTLASGHAYNTIMEMARAASEKGIQYLGICEHGPSIPGACDPIYFRNLHVVPRELYGVKLLLGAELNILDTKGTLDLDEWYYEKRLDIRIAGIHRLCWNGGTPEENTEGMITAIRNKWVNIISHPGDGEAKLIYEPIVEAAKESHTLLEINNSSFRPARGLDASHDNYIEILRLCKDKNVPVILGSDAHFCTDIANYCYLGAILEEAQFPERLILNDKPEEFFDYTGLSMRETN